VTPSKNTSALLLLGVSALFLTCYAMCRTWSLWAQGVLAVATVAVFPLLNSFGVFKSLGLAGIAGSQFRPRRMFVAVAFLAGTFVWIAVGVRLVPNPSEPALIALLLPALLMFATAIFFFIRGTLWP
jgi:hypothetical protein